MYHYTYMTVDENSGKYYVGRHSTNNLFDGYKGSGKWVRNYPKEKRLNLITYILEFFEDSSSLKSGEQSLINEYFQNPFCMNFTNNCEGWATGENNPTNLLTEEQKKNRSDNHWTKTEDASKWLSENNPSKMDHVKVMRAEKGKELWAQEEYRSKYVGDNHWTNQDTESAKIFLDRMCGDTNPAKKDEVRKVLSKKSKEQAKTGNFALKDPAVREKALINLRKTIARKKIASGIFKNIIKYVTSEQISDPSGPGAFVKGLMEGFEYILDEKGQVVVEEIAAQAKADYDKKTLTEARKVQLFQKLLEAIK